MKRKLKWIWFNIKYELPVILVGLLFVVGAIAVAYGMINMIRDHNCYIDGHYDTPECRKYIKED